MLWADIKQMFDIQRRHFSRYHWRCVDARIIARRFKRFEERDCCIALVGGEGASTVCFHPDVYPRLDEDQCLALIIHELAHVADPDLDERGTDALAERVTGIPIFYGHDDIQTTAGGVRPRPRRLPK